MLFCGLVALIASPVQAGDADPMGTADAAVTRCLHEPSTVIEPDMPRVGAPSGLARGADVEVFQPARGGGRVYVYRGAGAEIVCGVAVYGAVPEREARRLAALLDGETRWARLGVGPYTLSGARPARQSYWGDRNAPGVYGALMMVRAPSGSAPTLEIDVHQALVF